MLNGLEKIKMIDKFKEIGLKHPIFVILTIGFLVRLLFAVFPQVEGFAHNNFLYLETPYAWLNNAEYHNAEGFSYDEPQGISLFYLSINYSYLSILKFLGINNIQWLGFLTRLLNAFISLFVISFAYRIAELLSDKKIARNVALILSLLWFMPFFSIQNEPAIICCAFLMYATLIILRQEINRKDNSLGKVHRSSFIIAGIFLGFGFSIYYQSYLYVIGILLALMLRKNIKNALMTSIGFVISSCVVLVIPDIIVWGEAFSELKVFMENVTEVMLDKTLVSVIILLAFIPPLSVMLLCGFFKNFKNNILLTLPTLLVILHFIFTKTSSFLTIIPIYVILGVIGWKEIKDNSSFWKNRSTLYNILIGLSILVNFVAMIFLIVC